MLTYSGTVEHLIVFVIIDTVWSFTVFSDGQFHQNWGVIGS